MKIRIVKKRHKKIAYRKLTPISTQDTNNQHDLFSDIILSSSFCLKDRRVLSFGPFRLEILTLQGSTEVMLIKTDLEQSHGLRMKSNTSSSFHQPWISTSSIFTSSSLSHFLPSLCQFDNHDGWTRLEKSYWANTGNVMKNTMPCFSFLNLFRAKKKTNQKNTFHLGQIDK